MIDATEAKQIAQTIGQQLGGLGRVAAMISAYNFTHGATGALSFRFRAKAIKVNGKSPNYIKTTLDPPTPTPSSSAGSMDSITPWSRRTRASTATSFGL